jgi:hypothetical protein
LLHLQCHPENGRWPVTGMREHDDHTEDQYFAHMNTIRDIIDRWKRDEISARQKRSRIAAENARYYGEGTPLALPPRSGDGMSEILADSTGIPLEAASLALAGRRRANWESAHAEFGPDAQAIYEGGMATFAAVVRSAMPQPKLPGQGR